MAPKRSTQSSQSRLTCRNTPLLATMTRCPFSIAGRTPNNGAASTEHARCNASSRGSAISFRSTAEQLRQRRLHGHQHLFRKLRELAVEHVFPEFVRAAAILHEILGDVGMGEERPEEGVVPRVDFLGGRTVRHAGAALADGATVIDVEVRRLKERRLRRGSRVSLYRPNLPHLTGCRKHQPRMRHDLPPFGGS